MRPSLIFISPVMGIGKNSAANGVVPEGLGAGRGIPHPLW
jgi:hypothetical protein